MADDRQDGVGVAEVVGRRRREALDLPHHVVAQVADHAAVQGRQVGQHRRAVDVEQALDGGQHAPVEGDAGRHGAVGLDPAVAGHQGERRVAPHEGEPSPRLAVLHRLEQEAGGGVGTVAGQLEVGRHRRLQVGDQLPPHGHDGVAGGQGPEVVPAEIH